LKTTPPPIILDPVYQSGSTTLLYYLKTYIDINKTIRNPDSVVTTHLVIIYVIKWWHDFKKVFNFLPFGRHFNPL
jgi:hypothetical protein